MKAFLSLIALTLALALGSTALAQEQGYNEDFIRTSKVPHSVLQRAEKEAPGVKFSTSYRDSEKGYRLVGKKPDGSFASVRIDRSGELTVARTWTEVAPGKVPKVVSAALQAEIRKPPVPRSGKDLEGFKSTRIWLVEELDPKTGQTSTFYEFLGQTSQNPFYTVKIDRGGAVLGVSQVQRSPSSTQRQSFSPSTVAGVMKANLEQILPGVKLTRVVKVTVTGNYPGAIPNVFYRMYGRNRSDRAIEADVMGLSEITNLAEEIHPESVPKAVSEAIQKLTEKDKDLKGFRATEARRVRRFGRGGVIDYLIYGDNAYGMPLEIEVDDRLSVTTRADTREDWEVASPSIGAGEGVPPTGFAVLAAKYGNGGWIDVTDLVRAAIPAGVLKIGIGGSVPDPSYGVGKGIVVLYSVDGRVGLSTFGDGTDVNLPPRDLDPSKLAEVPARGFTVLAARFGVDGRWADVTDILRARVKDGKLGGKVADIPLPNPAPEQGKMLAIAYAEDGRVGLSLTHETRRLALPLAGPPLNSFTLESKKIEYSKDVMEAAYSQDGRQVVAGVEDGSIRVLDSTTGRETHRFDGHGPGRVSVAWPTSANVVLSGGFDKTLRLWDLKTDKEKAIFRGHTGEIHRVIITPNGRTAASWAWDRTLRIWDVATAKELRRLEGLTDVVDGLCFTPDGKNLITASWDRSVRVWDVATGKELRRYECDGGAVGGISITKDGKSVLVGANDESVRRIEVATARELARYSTYGNVGLSVAWLPDNHRFLAAEGTTVLIWDADTDRLIFKLERQTGRVRTIAVSPDGKRVVTGGEDKCLRFWNLP